MVAVEENKQHTKDGGGHVVGDTEPVVVGDDKLGHSYVDCSDYVENPLCNGSCTIDDLRFCPFYIRGKNYAHLCRYYGKKVGKVGKSNNKKDK